MNRASAALLLGASSMFANMYATQAILPEIGRELNASAAVTGLSITVVVAGVALGAWVHGPLSDRIGRWRVMVTSATLIVVPTALLGLAPNLPVLLALRAVQGLLMPGLLVVAVPYIMERFDGPRQGAAMGAYTSSLVFGGFVGRVGTAVAADVVGWRLALASLAVPTLAGALMMRAWLPADRPGQHVRRSLRGVVAEHARNRLVLTNAVCAGATFFGFVGIFTYATYKLTAPPIDLSLSEAGLVYGVWLVGAFVTPVTRLGGTIGPQRLLPALVAVSLCGALLTLVDALPAIVLGLALMAFAMFTVVPVCQLLIPRLVSHHRGTATSLHLTVYYAAGALGAYVPGLVLHRGWPSLVAVCCAAILAGLAAAVTLSRSTTLRAR
ncbi:MAG TPA: MFS transporter [Gaiellales bacterium]|nr:MFS transporter [Gaiellales bacterium]